MQQRIFVTITKYPTTEYIKSLLYKYIPKNKTNRKGLLLLPMQTGSGKTHATVEYIKEHVEKDSKNIMIYAVNTVHNLQETHKNLLKNLDTEYHHKVLFLKNNYDALLDAFKQHQKEIDNFTYLCKIKEFQNLKEHIQTALSNEDLKYKSEFKEIIENASNRLKRELAKRYKQKDFTSLIEFKKEVSLIYQTVNIENYSVIFLTTQKLYYPIFRLDGNKPIYAEKHFENAILFLDEFDTQKRVLLDVIIKNKTNRSYEFIDLFKRIADTLENRRFAKKYNIQEDIIKEITNYVFDINKKYNMQYGFKYSFNEERKSETILMNSSISTAIQSSNKQKKISTLPQKETNLISEDGEIYFEDMLKDVSIAIRKYIGMLKQVARTEVFEPQTKNKEYIPQENESEALDRITHDLIKELGYHKGDAHYLYLEDSIKYNIFTIENSFKSQRDELYEDGFKIINITQNSHYSETNDFESFELNNTPEKLMRDICLKLFVVGISATATIETLIKNFDIGYLKSKVNFITMSHNEIKKMDRLYIEAKKQLGRDIDIAYIPISHNILEIAKEYFDDGIGVDIQEYLAILKDTKNNLVNFERILRIVHSYREFLLHNEIETFMYLMSAYPRNKNQNDYGLYLEDIARLIMTMLECNFTIFSENTREWIDTLKFKKREMGDSSFIEYALEEHLFFYIYNSEKDNYNKYKKMFQQKRQQHQKIFIISTYQALGVGVNLEYDADNNKTKQDYDAIYMDLPRNLITRQFRVDSYKEDKIKALYELESLYINNYFTYNKYKSFCKNILSGRESAYVEYENTTDYYNNVMSMIIQAVGRLYRTDSDNSKMFLYLNSDITNVVKGFDYSKQTLLPAITKLIEVTSTINKKPKNENENLQIAINGFISNSRQLRQKILYMLKAFSNGDIELYIVKTWEKYRKFLISNPTVENMNTEFNFMYSQMPKKYHENRYYYYTQKDDYKEIEINFINKKGKIEVSREHAMLDIIENTQELQECVKKYNICLEFKHPYIMTPVAFNNLYKGALGEVLGRFLIEKYCSCVLKPFEINNGDEYERFDYKLEDNSVYFDFKYYSKRTLETQTQKYLFDKAKTKLSNMTANKALIINIFAEIPKGKSRHPSIDDDIMIVPFLIDTSNRDHPILDFEMIQKIKEFIYES